MTTDNAVSPPTDEGQHVTETASTQTANSAAQAKSRAARKVRYGLVVSDKMDKTVVVAVEDRVKHKLYGKVLRKTTRLKAHDETFGAAQGDRVAIMETRPLSATKRWRVIEVLEKAE